MPRDAAADIRFLDIKVDYATMEHIEALRKVARKWINLVEAYKELAEAQQDLIDWHRVGDQGAELQSKKRMDRAWAKIKELEAK